MSVKTPDWVKNAIFYQIYPDRFYRSPRTKHPRGIEFKPWGTPPEEQGFQGGNLLGIVDKLDYLQELGVNAFYLNPIFASATNHRYHTFDYFQVDPLLGDEAALRELIDQAHARDMRLVIDGVFNHASRGFWAFHHILEEGGNSPYLDWFYIHDWPLRPYSDDEQNPANYEAWWGIPALPKFNFDNPGVRDYFLDVAKYWIDFGVDGWRLDVPEEVKHDQFWRDFRSVVKEANPEAYIVGEIWHEGHDWLKGDRFDAVMNYVLNRAAFRFFGRDTVRSDYAPGGHSLTPIDISEFASTVEHMVTLHDWEIVQAQLNLLDSHDTARVPWILGDDETAHRLCVLFQMTMPGAPCIYYGTEIGMTGENDPYCRAAFPWDDKESWNHDLLDFHQRATAMRHRYPVLRTGEYATLMAEKGLYAFQRTLDWQRAVVVFNTSKEDAVVNLDARVQDGIRFTDAWNSGAAYMVQSGKLNGVKIPARSAAVLVALV